MRRNSHSPSDSASQNRKSICSELVRAELILHDVYVEPDIVTVLACSLCHRLYTMSPMLHDVTDVAPVENGDRYKQGWS